MNDLIDLCNVVTLTEAARMWHRHRKTILMQIHRGKIAYRKSGITGQYLLHRDTLVSMYGQPVVDFVRTIDEIDTPTLS